jgi:hypothetical protein
MPFHEFLFFCLNVDSKIIYTILLVFSFGDELQGLSGQLHFGMNGHVGFATIDSFARQHNQVGWG